MKKVLVAGLMVIISSMAQARQMVCKDTKTNKQVLSIVDDHGSIVTSSLNINGQEIEISDEATYVYFYGEYLLLKQKADNGYTDLDIVVVKDGKSRFSGKVNYYDNSEGHSIALINIRCQE